ncbi:hypothetical protein [uncultured Desulfuromonas sp.]|uniref:hypothetical protein n=1 Tax=uncultured Desulfuromonas sp. TaxID=181013 RepID=UPI002AAB94A1|nr:hypothetical protein [uncultured Desulfuromonas sp.]
MKNKKLIALNIEEAKEELESILSDLASDPEYTEGELRIALEHAYHHLNYAWNIRNVSEERVGACLQEDFVKWSRYPAGEINEYE